MSQQFFQRRSQFGVHWNRSAGFLACSLVTTSISHCGIAGLIGPIGTGVSVRTISSVAKLLAAIELVHDGQLPGQLLIANEPAISSGVFSLSVSVASNARNQSIVWGINGNSIVWGVNGNSIVWGVNGNSIVWGVNSPSIVWGVNDSSIVWAVKDSSIVWGIGDGVSAGTAAPAARTR